MIINAAIQVVPITEIHQALPVIDQAIGLIQQSGITYTVGPFETTLEGEYTQVQGVIKQVTDFCYSQAQHQFLVYVKYHLCGGAHILASAKTAAFKH